MANLPIASEVAHLCYTRARWNLPWTEQPVLRCLRITEALAPSHGTATFAYRYGIGRLPAIGSRTADSNFTTFSRPELLGHYVRVVIAGVGSWTGIITDQADSEEGTLSGTPTGILQITAFSQTLLLEKSPPIEQSLARIAGDETTRIGLALPFNGGSDGRRSGDRVSGANYDTALKCFSDRTLTATAQLTLWRARDAVEYLFANFAPKNASGQQTVQFRVQDASLNLLQYDLPFLEYHGQPLWDVLNRIIDRRRGLIWWFIVDSNDRLELLVDTVATTSVSLPGGTTLPANRNWTALVLDDYINVRSVVVSTSALLQYDAVIATGERAGVVCTLSPDDTTGQLTADWSDDEATSYNDAASNDVGYSTLSDKAKHAANADSRRRDALANVFSWWRLSPDWDGKAHNDGGTNQPAIYTIDDDGSLNVSAVGPWYQDGLRFADYLPMRTGIDYSGEVTPETSDPDDKQRDFLRPAVWLQADPVNEQTGSVDDGWIHAEHLDAAVESGYAAREFFWSVQIRNRDDAPGVMLQVIGAPQHYLAQELFSSLGSWENIPTGQGLDSTSWLATVYLPLQQHCFARYPAYASTVAGDVVRILRLAIPDAHLDHLVEGTVVGISGGALQQTSGGLLRDDRLRLADIARLAYLWYGTPRRTVDLTFRAIVAGFDLGTLVTDMLQGGTIQEINTVISSKSIDLVSGTTQVNTGFAELDFTRGTVP